MLNKVFLFWTVFDGKEILNEILLDSLAHVSQDERELLLTALKEEDLPEEQRIDRIS